MCLSVERRLWTAGDNDGEYFRLFVFSKIMLDFLHENVILICENLHIKLTKEKRDLVWTLP